MEPERERGQAASLDLTIPCAFEGLGIDIVSASESFQIMKGSARVASDGVMRLVNEVYLAQVSRRIVEVRGFTSPSHGSTWRPQKETLLRAVIHSEGSNLDFSVRCQRVRDGL